MKEFLGTEVGKVFMPPTTSTGSGNKSAGDDGVTRDEKGNLVVSDEALSAYIAGR